MSVTSPQPVTDPFEHLSGEEAPHRADRVAVRIWWPTPGLMATKVEGHLDLAAGRFIARSLRERLGAARVRLVAFHDWSAMTDYDSDARIVLTDAAREAQPRSDGAHFLISSSLVAFGLRTASVFVAGVQSYSDARAFATAMTSACIRLGVVTPQQVQARGIVRPPG